jgi:hypothetical protein
MPRPCGSTTSPSPAPEGMLSLLAGTTFAAARKIACAIDHKATQIKYLAAQDGVRAAGSRLALLREAAGRICVGIRRPSGFAIIIRINFAKIAHTGDKCKLAGACKKVISCPPGGAPRGGSVRSARHPDWPGTESDTVHEPPFVSPPPDPRARDTMREQSQHDRNVLSARRERRSLAPDCHGQCSRRSLRDLMPPAARKSAAAITLPPLQHISREGGQRRDRHRRPVRSRSPPAQGAASRRVLWSPPCA